MRVQLRLFAVARELAGENTIELELKENATVSDVRNHLISRLPGLEGMSSLLRFAVNETYAEDDFVISAEDELACIPPVSGG